MQRVRKQIGVPEEITGEGRRGITVAVLDSGISRHPDLLDRVICFRDFVGKRSMLYDDNGHGTHVCGILCGNGSLSEGKYRGIAPNTGLVVGKVLDDKGDGCAEHMLAGLEWVLSIKDKYRIRIINISVGIGTLKRPEMEQALQRRVDELWDCGIVVVCAAGNKGPGNNTISAVSGSRKVITVGCHDGNFCKDNPKRCETYSGRGPALKPIRKPDLVAPGTDIIACNAFYSKMPGSRHEAYTVKSGTSMATPIVSGVIALALEKFPQMSNTELKQKLTFSATDLGEPWNKQGWGMVNVKNFLK